jgi:hypothetical protein
MTTGDEPLPQDSIGDWLACDVCKAFIEKRDWEGLEDHALTTPAMVRASVGLHAAARRIVRQAHRGFKQFWTGEPPTPYRPPVRE